MSFYHILVAWERHQELPRYATRVRLSRTRDLMCEVFILGPSDLVDAHEMQDASGGLALTA
jgi:hypothetical protein